MGNKNAPKREKKKPAKTKSKPILGRREDFAARIAPEAPGKV